MVIFCSVVCTVVLQSSLSWHCESYASKQTVNCERFNAVARGYPAVVLLGYA